MFKIKRVEEELGYLKLTYLFNTREFRIVHYESFAQNIDGRRIIEHNVYVVQQRRTFLSLLKTRWNCNWSRDFKGYCGTNNKTHKTALKANGQIKEILQNVSADTPINQIGPTVITKEEFDHFL